MKKRWIILLMTVSIVGVLFNQVGQTVSSPNEHYELIRFHVLANSDTEADQELKLKVRDQIMEAMTTRMGDVKSIEDSRKVIMQEMDTIQQVAESEIERNQKDYPVAVRLERKVFPTRKYGSMILPAGEYEALSVVIGEGEGQNWWCVMFPPLCFVDIKNGLIDEETRLELESVLAEDEAELKLEVRSKIYDLYVKSKEQLDRVASYF